ncbi:MULTISPECIES: hypothetical protein [unclassified Saccharothrix]|uniref:hypothetical protein n=1 Tax=unclassified Saccharothrix TaxID=2593673 RepID=UPI00307E51F5
MDFSECVPIDGVALRQGDVIRALGQTDDIFGALGVLITADCDIAHAKHGGLLTYVPLLRLADYLDRLFLPKKVDGVLGALGDQLVNKVHALRRSVSPDAPRLTEDRVLQWVGQVDPTEVVSSLCVAPGRPREDFIEAAESYRRLQKVATGSLTDKIAAFVEATVLLARAKSPADAHKRLLAEVGDFVGRLPGDALLVNRLDEQMSEGYVAYLRLPREIRDWQIARTPTRISVEHTMERFARIGPPYIYQLTQQFSAVFASIGLPERYERERRETARSVIPPFAADAFN